MIWLRLNASHAQEKPDSITLSEKFWKQKQSMKWLAISKSIKYLRQWMDHGSWLISEHHVPLITAFSCLQRKSRSTRNPLSCWWIENKTKYKVVHIPSFCSRLPSLPAKIPRIQTHKLDSETMEKCWLPHKQGMRRWLRVCITSVSKPF